ncbi:MAG TPA: SDR family oxidoreductase [Bacillota bacterium]|nr:SDR family oxidoreductase [Bacillota bacterium]
MYVLITGASSGIGKELAYLYAADGNDLILVSRSEKVLNEIAKDIQNQYKINVVVKPSDLSVKENCYNLFESVRSYDIDKFINNAGYGNLGEFQKTSLDLELNMLDLNIVSVQILTKLFIQNFNKGTVVNVSSMAAFLPTPTLATYAASKSYVYQFSRAIDYELQRRHTDLRVLSVNPGPVKTNFNERANATISNGMEVKKCARLIYKGIQKKKALIIPGALMKIAYFFTKVTPIKLLLKVSYRIQNNK